MIHEDAMIKMSMRLRHPRMVVQRKTDPKSDFVYEGMPGIWYVLFFDLHNGRMA